MYSELLKDILAEQIEPGEPGDCYRNAYRYIGEHGGDVVHGKITNAEGKEIDHAWVENGEQVIDPTAGTQTTKKEYYRIANAKPVARYTLRDLTRLLMKTRHYGPFERYEPGDYADKKKPTYAGFSGVGRHDETVKEVLGHKYSSADDLSGEGYTNKVAMGGEGAAGEARFTVKGDTLFVWLISSGRKRTGLASNMLDQLLLDNQQISKIRFDIDSQEGELFFNTYAERRGFVLGGKSWSRAGGGGDWISRKDGKPLYLSITGQVEEQEEEDPNKMVRNRTLPVTLGLG